jgi:hypothetical protein
MGDRSAVPSFSANPYSRSGIGARWRRSSLLAAGILIASLAPALGQQPICKPQLLLQDVRLSPVHALQRTWSARVSVDAAGCAAHKGRFAIDFVRAKENAPDVTFSEGFTWTAGGLNVSAAFWEDEAPLTAFIAHVTPCSCREQAAR